MKKRWLCALMAVLMLFGLAACGATRGGGSMTNSASAADAAPAEEMDGDFGWTEDASAGGDGADFSAVRANAAHAAVQSSAGASRPNSLGRKRGQTFSDVQITDAARRVPIRHDSSSVFP